MPGRLASAMRSWGDDVSHYKGKAQYADVLLGYLDAMHQKQIEDGLDLEKGRRSTSVPVLRGYSDVMKRGKTA